MKILFPFIRGESPAPKFDKSNLGAGQRGYVNVMINFGMFE